MAAEAKRMFSGKARYHKYDIATGQLETAIRLFLVEGCDKFSAVTLAGAAGNILSQLALNAGKKPFIEYAREVIAWKRSGAIPSRGAVYGWFNKHIFVNFLKHHDPDDEDYVEFDVEKAAIDAIIKAISDYRAFTGTETGSMKAFLAWTYKNLDSNAIMERFKEVPEHLRKE
jgi:hypothetical protein